MQERKHLNDYFDIPFSEEELDKIRWEAQDSFKATKELSKYHSFNGKLLGITIATALFAVSAINQSDSSELKGFLVLLLIILAPLSLYRHFKAKKMEKINHHAGIKFREKYDFYAMYDEHYKLGMVVLSYEVERNGKKRNRYKRFEIPTFLEIEHGLS
ncbi:hypothetical protein [Vibrio casei]|uniref:hypothetical protein n=1 Tax=Vibrio casei TaxID=673372 RepID=UPI000DA65E11|nr:hypothetical protein [Vibrio casei]